jgi:CubicO group peptidase (beta-lactamase class C family)
MRLQPGYNVSMPAFAEGASQEQDKRFRRAFEVLRRGVLERVFPGAAVAISFQGELLAQKAVGQFTYDAGSPAVTPETIFDLASVTKVVATTAMAMLLYERGELDLDAPVATLLPAFAGRVTERKEISSRMLLLHSSGLPAYERLFERTSNREELLQMAMNLPLEVEPGLYIEYSDIGFIVLGELLQKIAGESLDAFCRREVFGRLGMSRTCFCPPTEIKRSIPPTENDTSFRHRVIQGEVHDENAWVLGGVSGHAGLFSSVGDVTRFAFTMLSGEGFVRPETIATFTHPVKIGNSKHALGWDVPTPPSQAGRRLSARSFGHLGYTGTSLWIDPERQLSITLLTNRTWPNRASQAIKKLRPEFHNEVVEAL